MQTDEEWRTTRLHIAVRTLAAAAASTATPEGFMDSVKAVKRYKQMARDIDLADMPADRNRHDDLHDYMENFIGFFAAGEKALELNRFAKSAQGLF